MLLFVKIFDGETNFKEFAISEEDDGLYDLLRSSSLVMQTGLELNNVELISSEEIALLQFNEVYDIYEETKKMDAKIAIEILEKLYRGYYSKKWVAFNTQLAEINSKTYFDEGEKANQRKRKFTDYTHFDYTCGVAFGILKIAASENKKITFWADHG